MWGPLWLYMILFFLLMSAWFQVTLHSNGNVMYHSVARGLCAGRISVKKWDERSKEFDLVPFFILRFFTACWLGKMLKDQPLKVPAAQPNRDPSAGAVGSCNLTVNTTRTQCSLPWSVFCSLTIPGVPMVGDPAELTQSGSWSILPADRAGEWSPEHSSIHAGNSALSVGSKEGTQSISQCSRSTQTLAARR